MYKEEDMEIFDEEAKHQFTNIVSVLANPEEACLGIGVRDVQNPNVVKVESYVHMSIPHFLRFAQSIEAQLKVMEEKGVITRELEQ